MSTADQVPNSPDSGAHFLLVGDSADLAVIQALAKKLPVNAYGQILIEVASGLQIQQWSLPQRISLHWLRRDRATSTIGAIAPRGELATRAVTAWVAEWMPEDPTGHKLPYILWIGCSTSDRVNRLYHELSQNINRIRLQRSDSD